MARRSITILSILIMFKDIQTQRRSIVLISMLVLLAPIFRAQSVPDSIDVGSHDIAKVDLKQDSTQIEINQEPQKKLNFFQKFVKYFDKANKETITKRPKFSFIGGPHYSSDTKFGIGLLAAGLYSTEPDSVSLAPSNVALYLDLTTAGYVKVGVEGLHLYKQNTRRIDYGIGFNFSPTYYWGIGVDNALKKENASKYLMLELRLHVDHLWEVGKNLFVGPSFKVEYSTAKKIKKPETWEGQPLNVAAFMVGAKFQYDSRDNYTAPSKGWLTDVLLAGYKSSPVDSDSEYASLEAKVCNFTPLWKNGVLASMAHVNFTLGSPPWCFMPMLGESGKLRGYYQGQYRDKQEFDVTFELRQRVYRRSGIVVWGGVGSVFPSFNKLRARYLLPTYGLGYRWEFKKNTNCRIDFGFGKKSWGFVFSMGEAF